MSHSGAPPSPRSSRRLPIAPVTLAGIAGAPGVAVAAALVVVPKRVTYVRRPLRSHEVDGEIERFYGAVERAQDALRSTADGARSGPATAEVSILEAYVSMLGDELLAGAVERNVRINRQCAEWAVSTSITELASSLAAAADPYLRERSHDFEFIGERLVLALHGAGEPGPPKLTEPAVLVARDLSPADLLGAAGPLLRGVVTEAGTRTSHTALLARSLDVPAVVGVAGLLDYAVSGDRVVVDGLRGTITFRPTDEMANRGTGRGERHRALTKHLLADAAKPAALASGERVQLLANIELSSEAEGAIEHGAEGVGLYRTEFLFVDRTELPDEEEQLEHYRAVVKRMGGRTVTFRTFDLGSDKESGVLTVPGERNPALGARAVRLALLRPELFRAQMRAMLRASAEGSVRVMVPMIASLREWSDVKAVFARSVAEVERSGHRYDANVPLGMMVEVPSAAILADVFAQHCAFFSLGTNDLVQYTLAVDRTCPHLAHLASPFDPAVLRLIKGVCEAAAHANRPLTVCGAMASDPLAALLLVGMGLRGLSMEPAAVPELKEALSRVTLDEARRTADEALKLGSASDVEHLVAVTFAPRLFDLLSGDDAA